MLEAGKKEIKAIDFTAMGRAELEEFAMEKSNRVITLEAENSYYKELLRKGRRDRFGSPSERYISEGQLSLFNEAEKDEDPDGQEPSKAEALPPPPKKKKSKGHKKEIVAHLPKETIEYRLTDDGLVCPKCGGELEEMNTVVRTEIEVIPAKYINKEYRAKVYSCRACDKEGLEGTVMTAPSPSGMFRNSIASPGMVADILFKKYALAQPLYRQEQELSRIGISIGRNTLANWAVMSSRTYIMPLVDHMKGILLEGGTLHADETPVQVLDEPGHEGKNSYMWVYRTGSHEGRQVVVFDYSPGRGAEFPKAFLGRYKGYLHCDAYQSYRAAVRKDGGKPPDIAIVACWAHARRYFTDIIKGLAKNADVKGTVTDEALRRIGALFKIEEEAKGMSPADRHEYRTGKAAPLVDGYFKWLKSIRDGCVGSLLKAVNYSLNQEAELRVYLEDGRLEISNNLCENALRPFCVGRRNWLFSATPNGAAASAACYSVIETAKANGIDAFAYLKHVFTVFKDSDIGSLDMEDYMPWSPSLPDGLRLAASIEGSLPQLSQLSGSSEKNLA